MRAGQEEGRVAAGTGAPFPMSALPATVAPRQEGQAERAHLSALVFPRLSLGVFVK